MPPDEEPKEYWSYRDLMDINGERGEAFDLSTFCWFHARIEGLEFARADVTNEDSNPPTEYPQELDLEESREETWSIDVSLEEGSDAVEK